MDTNGLIPHQTVQMIVDNVTQARTDIAAAFRLLQGAKERLNVVLGAGHRTHYGHLWEHTINDYDLAGTAHEVDAHQAVNAWRYILDQTGIAAYMTVARQKELQEQFTARAFPALTVANVLSTLEGLAGQTATLAVEFIREVFDWLRPHNPRSTAAQYKTNQRWRLGTKVVVPYLVDCQYRDGFRLGWGYTESAVNHVRALGNAFSLLDGQGVQRYPDDLVTQCTMALQHAKSGMLLTLPPYLELRPFKNGNGHLRFLRQDLVDRINQVAAEAALPGETS